MECLVNVDVDDLEKAVRFYQAALGLRIGRRFAFGVEMLGSSAPIFLLSKPAGSPATNSTSQPRDYRRHWTPVHLDFIVDAVALAVERALSAGALLEQPITKHAWGQLAVMGDPFGHGFCLIEFSGRGYDEIAESLPGSPAEAPVRKRTERGS